MLYFLLPASIVLYNNLLITLLFGKLSTKLLYAAFLYGGYSRYCYLLGNNNYKTRLVTNLRLLSDNKVEIVSSCFFESKVLYY